MIDAETINCWKLNYGLDNRTPAEAMQWWHDNDNGRAPAGAVAALGLCLDEIEALKATISCLEKDNADALELLSSDVEEKHRLNMEYANAVLELRADNAELERERMRLAACGVVAMANTPESAARARDTHPDYRSASCDDVARAVDSEMNLRAELASWQEAFGLLTTLHGSIQIDSSDPMGVAKQIESHVRAELADARAPDCRLCRHLGIASKPTGLEYECILAGTNAACADGHKYTGLIPVRLYEKE